MRRTTLPEEKENNSEREGDILADGGGGGNRDLYTLHTCRRVYPSCLNDSPEGRRLLEGKRKGRRNGKIAVKQLAAKKK